MNRSIMPAGYVAPVMAFLAGVLGVAAPAAAQGVAWVPGRAGNGVPSNAVYGGTQNDGEVNHVCQGVWANALHPGKLGSNGWCYIAYGSDEIKLPSYNILVGSSTVWGLANSRGMNPVVGGREGNHDFYICRGPLFVNGANMGVVVGKYFSTGCQVSYGGHASYIREFEELYTR